MSDKQTLSHTYVFQANDLSAGSRQKHIKESADVKETIGEDRGHLGAFAASWLIELWPSQLNRWFHGSKTALAGGKQDEVQARSQQNAFLGKTFERGRGLLEHLVFIAFCDCADSIATQV